MQGNIGTFRVGEPGGGLSDRVRELAGALPYAQATDNIMGFLWGKEAYGAMLYAGAVSDLSIAQVPRHSCPVLPRSCPRPVFRISTCHGLPSSGWFLGPGQRDVQVGQDRPLDLGEPVKDDAGWCVGEVQAVEGGQDGPGGGDGGAAFGQDAGQGNAVAEAGA